MAAPLFSFNQAPKGRPSIGQGQTNWAGENATQGKGGRGSIMQGPTGGLRPLGAGCCPVTCALVERAKGSISNESVEIFGRAYGTVRLAGWVESVKEMNSELCQFMLCDGTGTVEMIVSVRANDKEWLPDYLDKLLKAAMPSEGILRKRIVVHGTVGLSIDKVAVVIALHVREAGMAEGFLHHMADVANEAIRKDEENFVPPPKAETGQVETPGMTPSFPVPIASLVADLSLHQDAQDYLADCPEENREMRRYFYKAMEYSAKLMPAKLQDGKAQRQSDVKLVLAIMKEHKGVDAEPMLRQGLEEMELMLLEGPDYSPDMSLDNLANRPVYFI